MRVRTIQTPDHVLEVGDEWFSPDGVSPPWERRWNGSKWEEVESAPVSPTPVKPPEDTQ